MKKSNKIETETWLDLSEAASFLGVHFTTLRRWADDGQVPFIRTPGGRRRFSARQLEVFVQGMYQNAGSELALSAPFENRALDSARQNARYLYEQRGEWFNRLDEDERLRLRGTGHRLMALLMQHSNRGEENGAFLEEGKRIAREYSLICSRMGLPLKETVRVFLFFRRSIMDAIDETEALGSGQDANSLRLHHRANDFFDELLLDLVDSYPGA
jgi:excisionase family DNA binding protein